MLGAYRIVVEGRAAEDAGRITRQAWHQALAALRTGHRGDVFSLVRVLLLHLRDDRFPAG